MPGLVVGGRADGGVSLHGDGDGEEDAGGEAHVTQAVVHRVQRVGHVQVQLPGCREENVGENTREKITT